MDENRKFTLSQIVLYCVSKRKFVTQIFQLSPAGPALIQPKGMVETNQKDCLVILQGGRRNHPYSMEETLFSILEVTFLWILMAVSWLACRLVDGRSVGLSHDFIKWREVTIPCFYRSNCFLFLIFFPSSKLFPKGAIFLKYFPITIKFPP